MAEKHFFQGERLMTNQLDSSISHCENTATSALCMESTPVLGKAAHPPSCEPIKNRATPHINPTTALVDLKNIERPIPTQDESRATQNLFNYLGKIPEEEHLQCATSHLEISSMNGSMDALLGFSKEFANWLIDELESNQAACLPGPSTGPSKAPSADRCVNLGIPNSNEDQKVDVKAFGKYQEIGSQRQAMNAQPSNGNACLSMTIKQGPLESENMAMEVNNGASKNGQVKKEENHSGTNQAPYGFNGFMTNGEPRNGKADKNPHEVSSKRKKPKQKSKSKQ